LRERGELHRTEALAPSAVRVMFTVICGVARHDAGSATTLTKCVRLRFSACIHDLRAKGNVRGRAMRALLVCE
jgi:hypothetical protein